MTGPLPRFVVIGAMKAGTTSVHHYLDAHPDLFLPATKELNFFRDERTHAKGEAWYRQQFAGAAAHQVPGEVSPDYTKHPHHTGAPERMAALVPDVRLVYLLRHPVERMRSMYLHQVVAGREKRPADVALLDDPHYLECSQYGMQLGRYLEHFSPEQVLLRTSEELSEDRGSVLADIHRFVGVEPRPDSALAVDGEWYRSESRRRRGRAARLAAGSGLARKVFGTLPAGLQDQARRWGTKPVEPGTRDLSPQAEQTVVDRLQEDLHRLSVHAPEAVRSWGLLRSDDAGQVETTHHDEEQR